MKFFFESVISVHTRFDKTLSDCMILYKRLSGTTSHDNESWHDDSHLTDEETGA